jgi:signal transduction histidine kinase
MDGSQQSMPQSDLRLGFHQISDRTGELLRGFWLDLQPKMDHLLDEFYYKLKSVPHFQTMIGDSLGTLKEAQLRHWEMLFKGRFDEDYMLATMAIGVGHWRAGIEPHWFTGVYLFFINRLHRLVQQNYRAEPRNMEAVREAVSSAVMLDMHLVQSAYYEAMDEALKAEQRKGEDAARTKTGILASMSKDMSTPLNAVIGFSELLQGRFFGPLTTKQAEYVTDIQGAAQHMLALVGNAVDLDKVETSKFDLSEEAVDLAQLMRDCCQMVARPATNAGVTIKVGDVAGATALWVDRTRLKQILLNLLGNAVKHTPREGQVSLASTVGEDGVLTIVVADTGSGMTPEQIARAHRVSAQVGTEISGHHEPGTGLAIAEALIQAHGGNLTIESQPGKGTRCRLTLPRDRVLRPGGLVESPY